MSVWTSPCYSIEPLRNCANHIPRDDKKVIPEYLKGVANFTFGECKVYHKERSERNAYEFYSAKCEKGENNWEKFCNAGKQASKARFSDTECRQFANTLAQTNCEFAGIRAVYWAFEKFEKGNWKVGETFTSKEVKSFCVKAAKISGPTTRLHQGCWETAIEKTFKETPGEYSWLEEEAKADSVRKIWMKATNQNSRRIGEKRVVLAEKVVGYNMSGIKVVGADSEDIAIDESEYYVPKMVNTYSLKGASKVARGTRPLTLRDDFSKFKKLMSDVSKIAKKRTKIALSRRFEQLVVTLPYYEHTKAGSSLIIFFAKRALIFYDTRERRSCILFKKDHDRLVQMLQAHAKLVLYYSKYCLEDQRLSNVMINKYEKLLAIFYSSKSYDSDFVANRVCRAFDVSEFYILAELANDISDLALVSQRDKIIREKLASIIDVHKAISVCSDENLGVKEVLELTKFDKIFPCPDFCIYSVVDSLKKKADSPHPAADRVYLGDFKGNKIYGSYDELRRYGMLGRLRTYAGMYDSLPGKLVEEDGVTIPNELIGYPNIDLRSVTIDNIDYIDFRGTFNYVRYDKCENELVKDKTIAPQANRNDTRSVDEYKDIERNQVLNYLFNKEFLSQEAVNKMFKDKSIFTRFRPWILLALKAEAKKPGSRAFSMAMDVIRRGLSEGEANVAEYVKYQKGSSQGKSDYEINSRMAELTKTPDIDEIGRTVLMSFDLEGFSPMQNPKFKEFAFSSWEYCFDQEDFTNLKQIFWEGELVFDKFDVNDSMKMVGNDLEGFVGRINTAAHIDLMGYSVLKLKQLGLTSQAGKLEVLIDDGLLRLVAERSRSSDIDNRLVAAEVIAKIYEMSGNKISWDKTFISEVMCQYLNHVFYDGVEVTPGAKAFVRIGKKQEIAVPTLPDEIMAHGSTARGAMQNGADHRITYFAYLVEVYKTLRRYGMKNLTSEQTDRLIFGLYVPVALGGFGVCSMYGLATNEAFNSLQSGVANMKMISHVFRSYRTFANIFLNAGVREMDEDSILRNPLAIRSKFRCLNTRRFANHAKGIVLKKSLNTVIRAQNQGKFQDSDASIRLTIANNDVIDEIQRKELWDMSVSSYVESIVAKLQSSSTAAALIGQRKCFGIALINKSEAKALIREISSGKLSKRV